MNLHHCHRCIHAAGIKPAGPCLCPHDPARVDIIDHAQAGDCPLQKFTAPDSPIPPREASVDPPCGCC